MVQPNKMTLIELPQKEHLFSKGKLYKSKEHLLVYPSEHLASASMLIFMCMSGTKNSASCIRRTNTIDQQRAMSGAKYWSEKLDCNVRVTNSEDLFVFIGSKTFEEPLNKSEILILNLLFPKFSGWVLYNDEFTIQRAL